jgi:hypothetical protein
MASPPIVAVTQAAADAANQSVWDNLVFPLWVGLILGCIGYIGTLMRQRSGIRTALLADINVILPMAREIREYLEIDGHTWLRPGDKLAGAPVATNPSIMLFTALLPELYLLPKNEIRQVLAFYRHYELCEALTRSLYARIARLAEAGQPLTETTVRRLRVRRDRVCAGYRSLLEMKDGPLTKISDLPLMYAIPSTSDAWKELTKQDAAPAASVASGT